MNFSSLTLLILLAPAGLCQFPPTPESVTTLKSKYHAGVKISYKEPGICETTPGVKSYSGYVHLPPGLLSDINGEDQDYPINTFFWFFESRKDPINAPLAIWLNGGPGGSSLMGLLQENGPCFVNEDSNSTYLNPNSWNNEVNLLYIDQPSQVGFSYDIPTNCTKNLANMDAITPMNFTEGIPEQNNTFLLGTSSSQSNLTTANSTVHAAHAIWHFAQTWFSEFPFYKPHDDKISLWTESYGGRYGPAFFRFFQEQNEKIRNGTISEKGTHYIHLDTLGLINALLDAVAQGPAIAEMAYNNTYGIKAFNESQYETALSEFNKDGGCSDMILECQALVREYDPESGGRNARVNSACSKAFECFDRTLTAPYIDTANRGWYDIAHPKADPFPVPYMYGFLSQNWVQKALGVPVNYTESSEAVAEAFTSLGDFVRPGSREAVSYLLDNGVKVAMMFGDRDFVCNWIGGERISLAIDYSANQQFRDAGYSAISTTEGVGGMVRQHGNFSFSRVFQAGHEVPSYQPVVSYDIFMRAMFNKDIATGLIPVWDNYSSAGPENIWHIKNTVPEKPEPVCYILKTDTCTQEQYAMVKNGSAVIKNYILLEEKEDATESSAGRVQYEQKTLNEEL